MRTMRPLFLSLLAVLLGSMPVWAQTKTLSGRVIDAVSNAPMPNVNITVEGTHDGVATDREGRFTISLPAGGKLVITHIGYFSQKLKPDASNTLTIRLEKSTATDLGDVVVIGYGARKKATLTGSIVQVGEEVFKDRPLPNPMTALQGQIPGLQILRNSSRPGNEGVW
jgi:hypothetical protein